MSKEKLRFGYTTGTHATAALVACVREYLGKDLYSPLEIALPDGKKAKIEVKRKNFCHYTTTKGDNDDIDVTKGAVISIKLSEIPPLGLKEQTPSCIEVGNCSIFLYAGEGVGVVTKKGLKITPNHPAINPVPLQMMQQNIYALLQDKSVHLHAVVEVENGEEIAKQTANAKVGVIGGISILGTKGVIKPVSASAYIDSIEAEISVAAAENIDEIIFTLGNTAYDYAKAHFNNESSIVEVGNFVYDALRLLKKYSFSKLIFITSSAKMTKVAQGFKNTHNRYGSIDFEQIKYILKSKLKIDLDNEEFLTLKAILEVLDKEQKKIFLELVTFEAALQLKQWVDELSIKLKQIETITLPYKIKKELF